MTTAAHVRVPARMWGWLAIFVVTSSLLGALGPRTSWYLVLMPLAVGVVLAVAFGLITRHRKPAAEREPVRARARWGTVILAFVVGTLAWLPAPILGGSWGPGTPLVAGVSYCIALVVTVWTLGNTRSAQ